MKLNRKPRKWLPSAIAGLALVGSASLCLAQSPIRQTFDSGASSVADFGIDFGTGLVEWDATNGVGGSGCLRVTLSENGGTGQEIAAKWTITGGPLNTAYYLQVDYDLRFETNSGADSTGKFGNYQEVFRDAGGSWEGHWIGAINPGSYVDWTHMSFAVPNNGKLYPTVDWVLQGTAPYSSNVVFYVDNIVISLVPNPYVWLAFTNDISGWTVEGWTGIPGASSWNTSQDAGGGFTPLGSLELSNSFVVVTGTNAPPWAQSWHQHSVPWAPSRWDSFEFDVKVDSVNSVPNANGGYGQLSVSIRNPDWSDHWLPPGAVTLNSNYTSWQHVALSLSGHATNSSSPAIDFNFSGNHMGPVVAFIDNIKLTKPNTPPKIFALLPGTPGGVKMFVDGNGTLNQWDQEGIVAPAADCTSKSFFPQNQTPANYSFTISHFPSPAVAPRFQARMHIFNGDSAGTGFGYNQTYSGAPWNVPDYMGLLIENGTNGGVNAIFEWKTNMPSANPTNRTTFTLPQYATANGKWELNFSDNTHGTISGPDGAVAGTITLPDFQADPNYTLNFTPSTSALQFGLAKNDVDNTGVNNNQSAYFNHIVVTNMYGVIYDDAFPGPGLAATYAWRVTEYWQFSANRVLWQPYGTAYWLMYGEPAGGFLVESAGSLPGTWADAGASYSYVDATGTNHFMAVPTTGVPAGSSAYFRLYKTQ